MKTPKEKYLNDPEYRALVDMMENFIERAQFTPSEMREAAVFACVNYEMRRTHMKFDDPIMQNAIAALGEFANSRRNA
jgi:hypothetical protein